MSAPPQTHLSVTAVHAAARVVLDHVSQAPSGPFWRRWFERPGERHFADDVRAFVTTLDFLLDVPPQMLTREDIASVGRDVDEVVKKIEATIDDHAATGAAVSLAPAVYVVRERYEKLYVRGATKP